MGKRDSSFELLRLLSQYMIVLGHLFMVIVIPSTGVPFFKGMMFPLHVAVPCFVMISGYFGIKASFKGLINLLKFILVLYVPLLIAKFLMIGGGVNDVLSILFPISRTNTWFVRTYLWLFLISPLVNKALEHSTFQNKLYYTLTLFVISNYAGTIGNDVSLVNGNNIVTFLFYYLVGHLLSETKEIWNKRDRQKVILFYLICNVLVITFVSIWGNNRIVNGIFEYCFVRYNSPMLWINAISTFVIICGMNIRSDKVNVLAKSSLSIYLLHCSFVSWMFVKPAMAALLDFSSSTLFIFFSSCLLALMIVIICIVIHFLLSPIWKVFDWIGEKLQNRMANFSLHIPPLK